VSQAISVAKELVRLSFSGFEADPLTNLRLQKLLYYAQAWSLLLRGSELFPEDLQAWQHGPVVPDVYRALPDGQGAKLIDVNAFAGVPELQEEEAEFVRCVWEAYNGFSAICLSKMTHKEAPWRNAWGDRPWDGTGSDPISMNDLEDFFSKQSMPAPLAEHEHLRRKRDEEAYRQLSQMPALDANLLAAAARKQL
jgi:uncharacterized phage-associated protein